MILWSNKMEKEQLLNIKGNMAPYEFEQYLYGLYKYDMIPESLYIELSNDL